MNSLILQPDRGRAGLYLYGGAVQMVAQIERRSWRFGIFGHGLEWEISLRDGSLKLLLGRQTGWGR